MGVAGDKEDALCAGRGDQIQQTGTVVREVGPCLPARAVLQKRNARTDDTQGRGLAQLFLEPLPLVFAQHVRAGIGAGSVGAGV